jgi:hypothetical protein
MGITRMVASWQEGNMDGSIMVGGDMDDDITERGDGWWHHSRRGLWMVASLLEGNMDAGITVAKEHSWWHPCGREIWMAAYQQEGKVDSGVPYI